MKFLVAGVLFLWAALVAVTLSGCTPKFNCYSLVGADKAES